MSLSLQDPQASVIDAQQDNGDIDEELDRCIALSLQEAEEPAIDSEEQQFNLIIKDAVKNLDKDGADYVCTICTNAYPIDSSNWTVASEDCLHALCKECKKNIFASGYSVMKCHICREGLQHLPGEDARDPINC